MRKPFFGVMVTMLLAGCAFFPDFEHTPSARLPVAEVVNQIRCDMYEFLKDHHAGGAPFSLDTDSYATVELTLSTTAFGDVKFSKIDTVRLGATGFLAIGSSSQPFPSAGLKQSSQVQTKVTVNISQNPAKLKEKCEHGYGYGYGAILSDSPHADRVLINKMRVASWLKRTFESSHQIVSSGRDCNVRGGARQPSKKEQGCSVGLDNATLTTKFQLIGDVSGGILDLAKLIPVIATPSLQLNADYYHQIQIVFQGNNVVDPDKPEVADLPGGARRRIRVLPLNCDEEKTERAKELCKEIQKREKQSRPASGSNDARAIERQLRSIRDALILNGNRF